MGKLNGQNAKFTRRSFLRTSSAAATAFAVAPLIYGCSFNVSNFGGVRIGAITYSWRSMPYGPLEILQYCKDSGIGSLEVRWIEVESFAGIPQGPPRQVLPETYTGMPDSSGKQPGAGAGMSDQERQENEATQAAIREAQRKWRISAPMTKFEEFRQMYNDAGVTIHSAKLRPATWSDEEIDYAFRVAKALGANGVGEEISEEACQRLAPFAEKHNMYVYFHNHGQVGQEGFSFDQFLDISPKIMLNLDVGHFYGATGINPTEILEKYHDRILSIHLKDKTGPKSDPPNTNMPFGEGGTPLAEVLQLIQKRRWPIYCDIELEYPIPEGSDAVKEVNNCVEYCRRALT